MLSKVEKIKYDRHLLLPEIGEVGQVKLKHSKVLVVGAGGLGCAVLQYLTAAGTGTIGIIDFDLIEASNLQRQVLYHECDIGKMKATAAAEKLKSQNSLIQIRAYTEALHANNVEQIFRDYDILVDCTDNFGTRYLINDACYILKKPMIYGSVHRFEGQVSVFHEYSKHNEPPTYRCVFPEPPTAGMIPNCSEAGVLGVLPGIIGLIQANEVIKLITGAGRVLSGKLLCFDALTMVSTIFEINRNPEVATITPSDFDALKRMDYTFDCAISKQIHSISIEQISALMHTHPGTRFLDIRNHGELPEIPVLGLWKIPSAEIANRLDEIEKEKPIILFCKSGQRSAAVAELLTLNYGYKNIYSLQGGIDAWLNSYVKDNILV